MTFKIGQRVKRVTEPWNAGSAAGTSMPIGATGVVIEPVDEAGCQRVRPDSGQRAWGCDIATLAPLTDPLADQFIERIRKLKPLAVDPVFGVEQHAMDEFLERVTNRECPAVRDV